MKLKKLDNAFDTWNRIIFYGELEKPHLKIKSDEYFEGLFGLCFCAHGATITGMKKRPIIVMNSDMLESREEYDATLIHEMVHCWQYQMGYKVNHKNIFPRWEKYIYRLFEIKI